MMWLIAIAVLQLIVLVYIAARIETLADANLLARMLDTVVARLAR